jgi:hypothetical protein
MIKTTIQAVYFFRTCPGPEGMEDDFSDTGSRRTNVPSESLKYTQFPITSFVRQVAGLFCGLGGNLLSRDDWGRDGPLRE